VTHFCSFKVTHTENAIWNRTLPAGKKWQALSSTPKACGMPLRRRRRVTCSVSEMRPTRNTKTDQLGGGRGEAGAGFARRQKGRLPARSPYPFTSGVGSLLASKVGSFLASAEGQAAVDAPNAGGFTARHQRMQGADGASCAVSPSFSIAHAHHPHIECAA
jgi:hypothetical protein